MLGDEPREPSLYLWRKRVIGRAQVGKFGVAADGRNRPRIKERAQGRNALERTVRMPQAVGELKHALAAVLATNLIAWIQVGNIGEFLGHTQLRLIDVA